MYQTQQTSKETVLEIRIGPKEKTTHFKVYVYAIQLSSGPKLGHVAYIEGPIWAHVQSALAALKLAYHIPFHIHIPLFESVKHLDSTVFKTFSHSYRDHYDFI